MRRLAAIVMVDVVGYSRLMTAHEDETYAAWMELRRRIEPLYTAHGRIVKSTGDGLLIESSSVVEATRASLRSLEIARSWNDPRPDDDRLQLRIGINLGDVIVDEAGDIYGDGVNVAARLESIAHPGGLCLSDAAYQQVNGRLEVAFRDRGEVTLKNLPHPIRVWEPATLPGPSAAISVDRPALPRRRAALLVGMGVAAVLVFATVASLTGTREAQPGASTTAAATTASTEATAPDTESPWVWEVRSPEVPNAISGEGGLAFVSFQDGTIDAIDSDTGRSRWDRSVEIGAAADALVATEGLLVLTRRGSSVVTALDAASGEQAWREVATFDGQGEPVIGAGGGWVLIGYGLGVAGHDATTGKRSWASDPLTRLVVTGLATGRELALAADDRWIYGIDAASGTLLWEVGPPDLAAPAVWLSVDDLERDSGFGRVVETRSFAVTGDGVLMSLDPDGGAVLWSAAVNGTPAVDADLLVVADADGALSALDPATGTPLWLNDRIRPRAAPFLTEDAVLVLADESLVALSRRSGSELWRVEAAGPDAIVSAGPSTVVLAEGTGLVAVARSSP